MLTTSSALIVDLVRHATALPRDTWTRDQRERPLSEDGHAEATALARSIGNHVDLIVSSPALRCRQTIEPLAATYGLAIETLPELAETTDPPEPTAWTRGAMAPMAGPLAGGWLAGRAIGAICRIAARPGVNHAVACTHGDVIPVLLSWVVAAFPQPLPPLIAREGWYRLRFADDTITIEPRTVATAARA
jgi:broad specificity phosphatase PhoE